MIRSVTYQITGRKITSMAEMKYQLPAMLALKSLNTVLTAASVMPNSSASSCPGRRLAEKPPATPAKAVAIPASGWRPAAWKMIPASGISTT
jgi:hypothetical protein